MQSRLDRQLRSTLRLAATRSYSNYQVVEQCRSMQQIRGWSAFRGLRRYIYPSTGCQQCQLDEYLSLSSLLNASFSGWLLPIDLVFQQFDIPMEEEFKMLRKVDADNEHRLAKVPSGKESFNRYSNILPFKDSMASPSTQRYFNANFVSLAGERPLLIATQAPTPASVDAFWHLVWQAKVTLIISLCNCDRGLKSQKKQSEEYWPRLRHARLLDTTSQFYLLFSKQTKVKDIFCERQFILLRGKEEKIVTQLQYKQWPDFGVPAQSQFGNLAEISRRMKEAFMKEKVSLIHCSAGVGRTGTLLAILHKQLYPTTEVFRVVQNLRKHRMGMVQTVEQYGLISKFISHLLK